MTKDKKKGEVTIETKKVQEVPTSSVVVDKEVKTEATFEFQKDGGIRRTSVTKEQEEKVMKLLKDAREWMDKNKGEKPKMSFKSIMGKLGLVFSNAHNFSWEFSPHNHKGAFRDASLKAKVYVGRHHGLEQIDNQDPAKEPEIYFRPMTVKDIPEDDKEERKKFESG